jgi:drug/metabolite transporter (DMT)-like permease
MTTEGMKRLGIVLGVLASACWVIYVAVVSNGFTAIRPLGWVIFVFGIPESFGVAFLATWGVDWVVAGFRAGSKR